MVSCITYNENWETHLVMFHEILRCFGRILRIQVPFYVFTFPISSMKFTLLSDYYQGTGFDRKNITFYFEV